MRKVESLCTASENVKRDSHYGKQYKVSSKNKNRIIVWPETLLLGIYPNDLKIKYQRNVQRSIINTS